jgi:hypothetical protein
VLNVILSVSFVLNASLQKHAIVYCVHEQSFIKISVFYEL